MNTFRKVWLGLCLLVSARLCATAAPLAEPPTPILALSPAPRLGHAFDSSDNQMMPANLNRHHYREDEYFFSGHAHIYAFQKNRPNSAIQVLGQQAYVDRLLIRRPQDPKRFSGNVIVEVINAALGFDALAIWPYMQKQMMRAGDIWVGVSATPTGLASLQQANPLRYSPLSFGHGITGCGSGAADVGVIYDILTQTGRLLRQTDNRLSPLYGLPIKAIIATGYSQGALILASYTNVIAPNLQQQAFDGYISIAGIGAYALNNCESLADLSTRILAPISNGTPLMQIQTTSEAVLAPLGLPGESLHDQHIAAPYRYYDLAASGHLDGLLISHAPDPADLLAAGGYRLGPALQGCHLAYPVSQFPIDYVYANLLAKMEAWIRLGQAPPASRRFLLGGWLWPGHAVGGVRSPAADVPIADYFIGAGLQLQTHQGGFVAGIPCFFVAIQHDYSHHKLKQLYGNHHHYVEKVRRSTLQLQRDGFLLPDDAAEIMQKAAQTPVP